MRRILFVDDEPRILAGLENLLFPYMDEWAATFVESGEEALVHLAGEPFDVIVTDMRMPGMDGPALLRQVKDRYPDVVRIVLSGHSELEAALRAMPIAHQFLSKPCGAEKLIEVLTRACGLQALISDELVRGFVGGVAELPARPTVYSELTRLLADDSSGLEDVAAVVEQDIGISTNILHFVNTAFFSRGNTITTVRQAVPRLGATFVRSLVLSVEVFRDFGDTCIPGFSIERLHEHSFLTANIAKSLIDDTAVAKDVFLAGTLHDVGELVMASVRPVEFASTLEDSAREGRPLHEIEYGRNGVSHAEIGAYLLGLWGMPYDILEAVANHHLPRRAQSRSFDMLGAVHVASCLTTEVTTGREDGSLDLEYLEGVGVADRLVTWREQAASLGEAHK